MKQIQNSFYFKNDSKLSNYYICPVKIDGLLFQSSEAAYHAQKFKDPVIQQLMTRFTPDESKHVSRELTRFIRSDWHEVKYKLMKKVVLAKFAQNANCANELLNTKNKTLIEDTTGWHDNIWGECACVNCQNKEHQNLLGRILVEVRSELQN